jgi:hypothetical protein
MGRPDKPGDDDLFREPGAAPHPTDNGSPLQEA